MTQNTEQTLQKLVAALAACPSIRAVGLSGGNRPLPQPGESDIDLFLYCTEIPAPAQRAALLAPLSAELQPVEVGKIDDGHWGQGDCVFLNGIETWLLYFSLSETEAELDGILKGRYLERQDNYFYPIGRCAMWQGMRVLYDASGFIQSLKDRIREYPPQLQQSMVQQHADALADVEDLERAVLRQDVFFYHFAFDLALDHFLQVIFALNKEYFPSRKRSAEFLRGFNIKPVECEQRLLHVIELGCRAETVGQSYAAWQNLVADLNALTQRVTHAG